MSLHHMSRLFKYNNYSGTLEQFVDYFIDGDGKMCVLRKKTLTLLIYGVV